MNLHLMAYILEIIYQIKLQKELIIIYLEYKRTIQLFADILA